MTGGELLALIQQHNLDWSISAEEGQKIIQNRVLSNLLPDIEITLDENDEEVINEVPITDCTDRLCVVAGHNWKY